MIKKCVLIFSWPNIALLLSSSWPFIHVTLMIANKFRLPLKDAEPNYVTKVKRRAECHFTTFTSQFKSTLGQNRLHSTRNADSSALSDCDVSPFRQMFLALLLAVPLRTVVLSLHLSPVSHRLKQLVRHRLTHTCRMKYAGEYISKWTLHLRSWCVYVSPWLRVSLGTQQDPECPVNPIWKYKQYSSVLATSSQKQYTSLSRYEWTTHSVTVPYL